MKHYDFVSIGSGSAGFNAAKIAAAYGFRTAIVDGAKDLGGLCILRGCMPSKALLYMTDVLHLAQSGSTFGLKIPTAKPDMRAMHQRKVEIIGQFAAHRREALESGKFDLVRTNARFLDAHTLELADGGKISARYILVGTGSYINSPPIPGLAATRQWTSDEVLDLDFVPKSVLVLGGGIVGCELAQFLSRIGTRVTLIQRSRQLLSEHSAEAAETVAQSFRHEGIEVLTNTEIISVSSTAKKVRVVFHHNGKRVTRSADHLFNALGRRPNTLGLNLGAAGVKTRPDGQIVTNRWQQTSVPHIYAAGDCCGPHEIVHLAVQQGEIAARHAARIRPNRPIDPKLLLNVVFTAPTIATIGATARELEAARKRFLSASYPFDDHGKSILMEELCGFVKVLAEPKTGRILGAEIVGPHASDLIHCFSAPLAMRATVFDLLRAPWYHPTLAEILTYPLEEIAEKING